MAGRSKKKKAVTRGTTSIQANLLLFLELYLVCVFCCSIAGNLSLLDMLLSANGTAHRFMATRWHHVRSNTLIDLHDACLSP